MRYVNANAMIGRQWVEEGVIGTKSMTASTADKSCTMMYCLFPTFSSPNLGRCTSRARTTSTCPLCAALNRAVAPSWRGGRDKVSHGQGDNSPLNSINQEMGPTRGTVLSFPSSERTPSIDCGQIFPKLRENTIYRLRSDIS